MGAVQWSRPREEGGCSESLSRGTSSLWMRPRPLHQPHPGSWEQALGLWASKGAVVLPQPSPQQGGHIRRGVTSQPKGLPDRPWYFLRLTEETSPVLGLPVAITPFLPPENPLPTWQNSEEGLESGRFIFPSYEERPGWNVSADNGL